MGTVMVVATVSVDGFIADEDDRVGALFEWYGNGPVATTLGDPDRVFHVSEVSAAYLSRLATVGAGDIGGQALAAGPVDEVHMNVAPVVLGSGIRFFGSLTGPALLEDPLSVQGDRVRHDVYPVRRT